MAGAVIRFGSVTETRRTRTQPKESPHSAQRTAAARHSRAVSFHYHYKRLSLFSNMDDFVDFLKERLLQATEAQRGKAVSALDKEFITTKEELDVVDREYLQGKIPDWVLNALQPRAPEVFFDVWRGLPNGSGITNRTALPQKKLVEKILAAAPGVYWMESPPSSGKTALGQILQLNGWTYLHARHMDHLAGIESLDQAKIGRTTFIDEAQALELKHTLRLRTLQDTGYCIVCAPVVPQFPRAPTVCRQVAKCALVAGTTNVPISTKLTARTYHSRRQSQWSSLKMTIDALLSTILLLPGRNYPIF